MQPIGQGCIEQLHKHLAHIFLDPLIVKTYQKVAPLFGLYGRWV